MAPTWKAALLRALHVFERHHLLDVWEDGKIRVSTFWDDDILQAMTSAQLAVILLTDEALKSEYILTKELPCLRERQQREKLPVFPVICEPCDWKAHDWLRATQAPNESNPLSGLPDDKIERVFHQLATDIAENLSHIALVNIASPDAAPEPTRLYLDKFPLTRSTGPREEKLIGREQELALLDLAFAQPHTAIVSLVAWGGVGKTMLVQHWLQRLQNEGWFGVRRVYAWSFYSQGTKEDRQASEDTFLAHALEWFGVQCEPTLSPWDKGRLLADAVARERTLLIIDGIEPLQYPPGPMGGQLRAPGVQSLLKQLARKANDTDHRGLCLVTTREPLTDLVDFERRPDAAWGSVLRVDLGNLTEEAGAALLHHAGAKRAGAAEIKADAAELLAASREVDGHALTLNLLGRFLARAHGGDIRRRDLVKFEEADRKEQGGTTFKMLAAFENWFAKSGEFGARQLAVLRMLGLFDRPGDAGCIAALRNPPAIAGLTDPLFTARLDASTGQATVQPLLEEDWNTATSFLSDFGLVNVLPFELQPLKGFSEPQSDYEEPNAATWLIGSSFRKLEDFAPSESLPPSASRFENSCALDVHPLVRDYFGRSLRERSPEGYQQGHRRLYDHLKVSAPFWPDGLESLEPLHQALVHGCQAGLHDDALENVYEARIQRRGSQRFAGYNTHVVGAWGANLQAVTNFFERPWTRASSHLHLSKQVNLLSEAAMSLRSLGRLLEAVEPMRAQLEIEVGNGNWRTAALSANNLSELELTLGEVRPAVSDAKLSVTFANRGWQPSDRSPEASWRVLVRTTLGDSLHQAEQCNEARDAFHEAMQIGGGPQCVIWGLAGFQYCDLLLAKAECAVWRWRIGNQAVELDNTDSSERLELTEPNSRTIALRQCSEVEQRAAQTLSFAQQHPSPLEIALDHLTLSRTALYEAVLSASPQVKIMELSKPGPHLSSALDGLRRAGAQEFIPRALLTRAWLRFLEGDAAGARADLDEAWDIAERGPMRLHLADIHLHRARLFFREQPYPWKSPQDDLAAAEKLIHDCGYHRRDEELADAKKAIIGQELM